MVEELRPGDVDQRTRLSARDGSDIAAGLGALTGRKDTELGDQVLGEQLARRLGYDASNLTGIVDKLEDRGAVERRADPTDRRVKAIAATEHGLGIRENLSQRLRTDAGPVKALTDASSASSTRCSNWRWTTRRRGKRRRQASVRSWG